MSGRRRLLGSALAGCLLAGCSAGGHGHAAPAARSPSHTRPAPISPPAKRFATTMPCITASAVAGWPLSRRAASLVVVPVKDFDVTGALPAIAAGASGVLFLGTAAPPASLATDLRALTTAARSDGNLLVMADEEGGGVQRLAGAVSSLPWPRDMARTMSPDQVRARAASVGRQMRALGVTVDLAPVADVDDRPGPSASNPDGRRSFSGDPAVAARYVVAFLAGLQEGGVLPVVKHFPGLGGSTGNTDEGAAATLPLASLKSTGLPPFAAAIEAGAPAVMVANAAVPGASTQPAALSSSVVSGLLRTSLHFSGLVVTDSLSAGAISAATPSVPAAAANSIAAGADVVLYGSTLSAHELALLEPQNVLATFRGIVQAVSAAVASGQLSQSALNSAVVRVLTARHVNPCA